LIIATIINFIICPEVIDVSLVIVIRLSFVMITDKMLGIMSKRLTSLDMDTRMFGMLIGKTYNKLK